MRPAHAVITTTRSPRCAGHEVRTIRRAFSWRIGLLKLRVLVISFLAGGEFSNAIQR
jgi:hypothetical protein